MPVEIITRPELVEYGARAGVGTFSNELYDRAIRSAVDRIRQATLNEYTSESFESLTASTAPDEMRDYAFALALGILTKGAAGRPATIGEAYVDASRWLGYIVAGKTHYDQSPGAVLVKIESDSDGVTYQAPESKYPCDPMSIHRRN